MEPLDKRRVYAIDIIKVIAVFIVMNSHMEICYGNYHYLATGGAIGDALFFFCSGFTILLGDVKSFPNYYKRRVSRIYPVVLVVAFISSIFFMETRPLIKGVILGGGWFVNCILLYYIPLFFVKKYGMNSFGTIWLITSSIIILSFFMYFGKGRTDFFLYGKTFFKWVHYFIFMLYGGYIGCHQEQYHYSHWCILKLIACIIVWYSCFLLASKFQWFNRIQFISLLPLLGIVHYIYLLCCHPFFTKIAKSKVIGQIVYIIGGLCLESYLIQSYIFSEKLNWLFPINIPIMMLLVLMAAYGVNFLSNIISQTFKSEDYDYKKWLLYRRG